VATEILRIAGGRPLHGLVSVEGAKNAALPACVASLLTDEPVTLQRIPELRDVSTILFALSDLGKRVVRRATSVVLGSDRDLSCEANAYAVRQMRASFLVLAPLVARLGRAVVPLPGGCAIGNRSVDLHLDGLRAMGATIEEQGGIVRVTASRLRGARIQLRFPSVGATEQLLMASVLAAGESEISRASVEPEVLDLVELLRHMGAKIERESDTFHIEGVDELHGATHEVIPDRMEAGTYLLAGAITEGEVRVEEAVREPLGSFVAALEGSGLSVVSDERSFGVRGKPWRSIEVETAPHPGFPTDLHPQLASFLALAQGVSRIRETIFERRHTYVAGLRSLGAMLAVDQKTVTISGVGRLSGGRLSAPDIRSGAALVLAALAAQGESVIDGLDKLDRGYAHIVAKLRGVGAEVERETA